MRDTVLLLQTIRTHAWQLPQADAKKKELIAFDYQAAGGKTPPWGR
ncbi:MAG: hypothetical protein M3Y55_03755 [Pseudomonadota bacterium]|nr:hypothetical protein [Pseudomonadota bacterium]